MTTKTNPVLAALFALEDQIRALPAERQPVAITLAVSRLRRLHPARRRSGDLTPAPTQLDLERELLRSGNKP